MVNSNNALRFPYVLFDLGGTLIYFDGEWSEVMLAAVRESTRALRSMGYNLDEQAFPEAYLALINSFYEKRNGKFVEYTSDYVLEQALAAHSYPHPPAEHMHQALKAMYAVTQSHWHAEADAAPTLEALRGSGHRLGIVSNAAYDEDVQTLVDNACLRPYFDFILTSAWLKARKPGPQIFEEALGYWNARPEQTIMIGDTVLADVAGANNMGIASVWITRRADFPENRSAAQQYPPSAIISTLSELPELLKNWPEIR